MAMGAKRPKSNAGRTYFGEQLRPAGTAVTATGIAIGTADTNRLVVVLIHYRTDTGTMGQTISSCAIGGVSANFLYNFGNTGGTTNRNGALFGAIVPTGTTADITFTSSLRFGYNYGMAVYSLYDLDSPVPTQVQSAYPSSNTSGALTINMNNVNPNAYILAASHDANTQAVTAWTGPLNNKVQITAGSEFMMAGDNFSASAGTNTFSRTSALGLFAAEFN